MLHRGSSFGLRVEADQAQGILYRLATWQSLPQISGSLTHLNLIIIRVNILVKQTALTISRKHGLSHHSEDPMQEQSATRTVELPVLLSEKFVERDDPLPCNGLLH
jgi:hypothetical protein